MFENEATYLFFGLAVLGFGFAFFRNRHLHRKMKEERELRRPRPVLTPSKKAGESKPPSTTRPS